MKRILIPIGNFYMEVIIGLISAGLLCGLVGNQQLVEYTWGSQA